MTAPIYYVWNGHAMEPMARFSRLAEQSFTAGRAYRLIVDEERSTGSHRQYFAAVREAWLNLPEDWADRFPTPDHLRKWCLIKAGFRLETTWVVPSHMEAVRTAEALRKLDDYAVVVVDRLTITHCRAKSQNYRAMSKGEFQRSKQAVLDLLAKMIEVTPEELSSARAA